MLVNYITCIENIHFWDLCDMACGSFTMWEHYLYGRQWPLSSGWYHQVASDLSVQDGTIGSSVTASSVSGSPVVSYRSVQLSAVATGVKHNLNRKFYQLFQYRAPRSKRFYSDYQFSYARIIIAQYRLFSASVQIIFSMSTDYFQYTSWHDILSHAYFTSDFTRYLRYMHAESLGSLDLIVVGTDEARAEGGDQWASLGRQ